MPYVASTLGTYSTGTVTVVNGSTAVTGSGTVWGDIVNEGDLFTIDDDKFYYVAALNSDTSLTLDKPYAESSASGINYRVMLNTAAHFPSDVAAKVERALSGMGDVYCPIDHASSGSDYGLASASLYGHAKASGTTPKAPGTAAVGTETNKFARGDHVHPHDDTKLDISIAKTYLPLSGGTLSGDLKFSQSGAYIQKTTDSGTMAVYSGSAINKGAELVLYGKDHGSQPGEFSLRAKNGVDTMILRGYPNGTLTWDGKDVATIRAGDWTPELVGNSTPGTYTYKTQYGTWLKIGNLVYITADIDIGDYTVHPYGRAYITGLPFAVLGETTAISVRGTFGQSNCFLKCVRAVTGNGYTRIFLQGIDQTNNTVDDLTFSNSSQTSGRYLSLATPSGTNTTGRLVLSGCYRSQ